MFSIGLYVIVVLARNYGILVNCSKNYTNFRHMADIQLVYNVLLRNGFKSSDILMLFNEDQIQDQRNKQVGTLMIHNVEIKYHKIKPTVFDAPSLISMLRLRHRKFTHLDENDNLLIFICGHGKNQFLKICDIYCLFKDDIMDILKELSRRLNNIMLVLDTCEAESLIDFQHIPENALVVCSSSHTESAYSLNVDRRLGISPADELAYSLYQMQPRPNELLNELLKNICISDMSSTLVLGGRSDYIYKDFFIQNNTKRVSKPFKI